MIRRAILIGAMAAATVLLGACTTVRDILGEDSGHVQLSCSSSAPLPGMLPLQSSLSPLTPGTTIEILRAAPQGKVLFTLPPAVRGDDFSYAWDEPSTSSHSVGGWQCRAEWRYDGRFWRLQHFDSHWAGAAGLAGE